jgi:hypothetical protein
MEEPDMSPENLAAPTPPWKKSTVAIVSITLMGVAAAIIGYASVNDKHESFGIVMFCLLPFLVGFPIGYAAMDTKVVRWSLILTGAISLGILIGTGQEGWICCFMAFPIITLSVLPGALIGHWVRKRLEHRANPHALLGIVLVCSAGILTGAAEAEKPHRNRARYETFETRVFIPAPPERAWALIEHMDKVEADKPFLIRIGLPTPVRCELEGKSLGGKRICIFDQGRIEQEVTGWDPPRSLTTRITGNTLPGRRWLGFRTAGYDFKPVNGGTEVTRKSEISSRLYPRWYWRPLEAWGVLSEHDYVLSSVKRNALADRGIGNEK